MSPAARPVRHRHRHGRRQDAGRGRARCAWPGAGAGRRSRSSPSRPAAIPSRPMRAGSGGRPRRRSPDDVCMHALPLPAAPALAAAAAGPAHRPHRGRRPRPRSRPARRLPAGRGRRRPPRPLRRRRDDRRLAARIGLPLLVVGRMALGTINHVALTLAEAARRRLRDRRLHPQPDRARGWARTRAATSS